LGHTFAHAVEAASDYAVLHGEAVAMGLVASARLGASLGVCDPAVTARLQTLLSGLGLPTEPPAGLDPERMLEALEADKKRRGGQVTFVLPCPGGVDLVTGLEPSRALAALSPEEAMVG
ncbi:MAG TPA: 3-dehydroquinate synthase, partial [Actinomycetota bacterium]|nr:3-dehydroquinate synthase [Actinomycetota bacterium]